MRSKRRLGAVEAVGVAAARSPRVTSVVRPLGVGQVRRGEQLTGLGQRLVEAPERREHAEGQRRSGTSGPGRTREHDSQALGGDAVALGGPLQVLARVRVRRRTRRAPGGPGRTSGPRPRRAPRACDRRCARRRRSCPRRCGPGPVRWRRAGAPAAGDSVARSTARSMSDDGLVDAADRAAGARPAAAAARVRARRVDPRRASRLSIGRGSTVSATDSLSPRIIAMARSWSPASRTRPMRLEHAARAAACRRRASRRSPGRSARRAAWRRRPAPRRR